MAVDLILAKQHCRVLHDQEDDLLLIYLAAAKAWIENYTGLFLEEFAETPADLDAAVLLLVGDFYINRESGSATPAATMAVQALCHPYRPVLV